MKLALNRHQAQRKGMFIAKGIDFKLGVKLELTRAETDLADHYQVKDYVLLWKIENNEKVPRLTVAKALTGITFSAETLPEIQSLEKELRQALENFKNLLDAMPLWQNREEIDLNPPADDEEH